MGMKPRDKMIDCVCVEPAYAEKPDPDCRRCKGTGKIRKRTGKSKVVWVGSDGQPIRVVLVDADTTFTLPCRIVIERGTKNATGRRSWYELNGDEGGSNALERRLAYELAKVLGDLPYWAQEVK